MLDAFKRHNSDLTPKTVFILLLVFFYPSAAVIVPNAGGVVLLSLIVAGMTSAWDFRKKLLPWENRVFAIFAVFFVVAALSLVNTQDTAMGLQRLENLIQLPLSYFAYLYIRKSGLNLLRTFLWGMVLAAFTLLFVALYDTLYLRIPRAAGVTYAIFFGGLAVVVGLALLGWLLLSERLGEKGQWVFAISSAMAMMAAVLSGTKGALIYIPMGLLIILFFMKGCYTWRRIGKMVFVVAIVGFGAWLFDLSGAGYHYSPTERVTKDLMAVVEPESSSNSTKVRLELWKIAYSSWLQNPVFGTGLGDFREEVKAAIAGGSDYLVRFDQAHSNILNLLATTGLVGLSFFLLASVAPWLAIIRSQAGSDAIQLKALATLILVGFFVFGLTETWLTRNMFIRAEIIFMLICMSINFVSNNRDIPAD